MNDEHNRKHRKLFVFAIIAFFFGMIGIILPEQEDIAFEIVKNNTDMCDFNHVTMSCNGTRQNNITYYTNETSIVLSVFAHANVGAQTAGVFVYRDDILLEAQSGRPLVSPEQTWRGVVVIIPKNSSYRVNFTNYHHFEWREDRIISGRNGTLSINNTNITYMLSGGNWTIDANFTNRYLVDRVFNTTYHNNQSKPLILDFNTANLTANVGLNYSLYINDTLVERIGNTATRTGNFYYFIPQWASYKIMNTSSGISTVTTWYEHNLSFTPSIVNNYYNTTGSGGVSFNGNPVNLNGSNLYNGTISNYSTLDFLNSSLNNKVNKSGDNWSGNMDAGSKSIHNLSNVNRTSGNFDLNLLSGIFTFTATGVSGIMRNYTTANLIRTDLLAAMNLKLNLTGSNSSCSTGCGASLIFWNVNNASEGGNEVNLGRFGYSWHNKTIGSSKIAFYSKSGIADNDALSPVFRAYTSQLNASTREDINTTYLEVGNLKVDNVTVTTAYQPLCLSPSGTIVLCP